MSHSEFQGRPSDGGWGHFAERLSASDRYQMAGGFNVKVQRSVNFGWDWRTLTSDKRVEAENTGGKGNDGKAESRLKAELGWRAETEDVV